MALMRALMTGNQWGQTLSLKQAQAFVLEHDKQVTSEEVILGSALGRVLAEDVIIPQDMPPHPVALTDGYAIRFKDAKVEAAIAVSRTPALDDTPIQLPKGSAAQIIQGARLPMGADTVIRPDQCMYAGYQLRLHDDVAARSNVTGKAEFAKQGQVIMEAGAEIHHLALATLAEVGIEHVTVCNTPTITAALFSPTPEDPLACHSWLAQSSHGADVDWHVLPSTGSENNDALINLIKASDAHMIVLGGDMSELDWHQVQLQMGGGLNQVNLPDGQHLMLGELDGTLVVSLPLMKQELLMAATWLIQPWIRQQLGQSTELQQVPVSRKLENPAKHERLALALSEVGSRGLRLKPCKGESAGTAGQAICANGVVLIPGRSEITIGQKAEFLSF